MCPVALQYDMIGVDFREPYAGNDIVSFAHGKYLSCVQLYYRVPMFARNGRDDSQQSDCDSCGHCIVLAALRASEQTTRRRNASDCICSGRRPRPGNRRKPDPSPVRQNQAEQ